MLAFDGGGIRGALSLELLAQAEKLGKFTDSTMLFAGTSTGSFIALGLAMGLSAHDLLPLYTTEGSSVFVKEPHPIERVLGFEAKYTNTKLKELLEDTYSKKLDPHGPLSTLPKAVAIPSFKLRSEASEGHKGMWEPVIFSNVKGSGSSNISIIDAALASSAAPTYFPSYKGYIDGGVAANNPSLAAISSASLGGISLSEMHLLSIGTGYISHEITREENWGALKWIENLFGSRAASSHPLLALFSDAEEEMATLNCKNLLKSRFCRLNVPLKEAISLDDWTKADLLIEEAKEYFKKTLNRQALKNWLEGQ